MDRGEELTRRVEILKENDYWLAHDDGMEWGAGDTLEEAWRDYWECRHEMREMLEEDCRLGRHLQRRLNDLRKGWQGPA